MQVPSFSMVSIDFSTASMYIKRGVGCNLCPHFSWPPADRLPPNLPSTVTSWCRLHNKVLFFNGSRLRRGKRTSRPVIYKEWAEPLSPLFLGAHERIAIKLAQHCHTVPLVAIKCHKAWVTFSQHMSPCQWMMWQCMLMTSHAWLHMTCMCACMWYIH